MLTIIIDIIKCTILTDVANQYYRNSYIQYIYIQFTQTGQADRDPHTLHKHISCHTQYTPHNNTHLTQSRRRI